jgi:hypothetical protein
MPNMFICIYSGGVEREVHETFLRGAQATKVWESLVQRIASACHFVFLISKHCEWIPAALFL